MSKFILRIRHSKGTTRFELTNKSSTTIKQVKELICTQLSDHPAISTQHLTLNGKSTDSALSNNQTLSSLHIKHGDMLYLKIISSAIVCHSNTNNSRKRKLNDNDSSNTLPPAKRRRLHTNNNNNHNHNNTSLVVHTLSNTQPTSNSTNSTTSNVALSNPRNTNKKPSKKSSKKKKKKKKDEFLIIESEGDTVEHIAQNYISETNALQSILNALPTALQSMYTKEARIDAILNEKVEVTEHLESSRFTSKAKSRGKRFLIVMYSFKRKKRKETVCFYDDEKMEQIINGILWETVDETEREREFVHNKINHKNIMELIKKSKLTLIEMAQRSPALLWSLYHSFPNQEIEHVLEKIVKSALRTLRIKAREML